MVVYEIGVGPLETCRSRPYWEKDECVLFEPLAAFYQEIVKAASKYPNVKVHNVAIYDHNGQCDFVESNQLSHVKGLNSPYIQRGASDGVDKHSSCAKISEFDKGNIDLLLLDMEGAEWFALKYLVSRPKKIVVETQTSAYENAFLKEIREWMLTNKYREVEHTGADTVWEKPHKVFL